MYVFEWDCETVIDGATDEHEDGEVIDHCHTATFAKAMDYFNRPSQPGTKHVVCLVRDDDDTGGRSWAYVQDSRISKHFWDAYDRAVGIVPRRFVQEVAKYKGR